MLSKAGVLGQKLDSNWGIQNNTGLSSKCMQAYVDRHSGGAHLPDLHTKRFHLGTQRFMQAVCCSVKLRATGQLLT